MARPQILIIEDAVIIRELLEETLNFEGYCVTSAEDGAQGLVALERYSSSLKVIVTDLEMPVMNGHQFLSEMKRRDLGVQCVIIMSASIYKPYPEYINLNKPFDVTQFLKIIAGVFSNGVNV